MPRLSLRLGKEHKRKGNPPANSSKGNSCRQSPSQRDLAEDDDADYGIAELDAIARDIKSTRDENELRDRLDEIADVSVTKISKRYTMGELLGEGRFSQVFSSRRVLPGGKMGPELALKEVAQRLFEEQAEETMENLLAEIAALRTASSGLPGALFFARLHEVVSTGMEIYLVLDRIQGRELFHVLDEHALPVELAKELTRQLLKAVAALHAVCVVHRDIKPENLMVSIPKDADGKVSNDPSRAQIFLIDFGWAGVTPTPGAATLVELAGSPGYCAPEVFAWMSDEDDAVEPPPYSSACDVFSCGVTVYIMLSRDMPYSDTDDPALVPLTFTGAVWRQQDLASSKDFIRALCAVLPTKRPTAQQALEMSWLQTSPPPTPHARTSTETAAARPHIRVQAEPVRSDGKAEDAPSVAATPAAVGAVSMVASPGVAPPGAHAPVKQTHTLEVGALAKQLMTVTKASQALKRLAPLEGKLLQGGFPGAPIHASMQLAVHSHQHASCYERARDASFVFLLRHNAVFTRLAVLVALVFVMAVLTIIVFFWGVMFGIGVIDPDAKCDVNTSDPSITYQGSSQYPPKRCIAYSASGECLEDVYVADFCNLNQYMFNLCIKAIMICLTYINFLPIPWRVAIGVDAWGDALTDRGRHEPPGLDFYGRETEALWFHIPRHRRALIALLLNLAWVSHMVAVGFCLGYWSYVASQTWPGALAINLPGIGSFVAIVSAGVLQSGDESKLIAAQPKRFPPAMSKILLDAFVAWKSGKSGKPLRQTVRDAFAELQVRRGSHKNLALVEINMDAVSHSAA
jgi:serine/threonine protein kinase